MGEALRLRLPCKIGAGYTEMGYRIACGAVTEDFIIEDDATAAWQGARFYAIEANESKRIILARFKKKRYALGGLSRTATGRHILIVARKPLGRSFSGNIGVSQRVSRPVGQAIGSGLIKLQKPSG